MKLDTPGRSAFEDPTALDQLRRSTFETVGVPAGLKILYGIGLLQGLVDGHSLSRGISGPDTVLRQPLSAPIRMIFAVEGGDLKGRFSGTLNDSTEAMLHVRSGAATDEPACGVSAGYAAGWYSGLLDATLLVREIECASRGAPACRFEARPLQDWIESGSTWSEELVPYVDFAELRERALELLDEEEPLEREGSIMGSFDPMSPAAHVWGPVMVLPYSGFQDSEAAIAAILADLGPEQIEVAVIDVTGAQIDALEALGLLQLLNELESRSIETILVGLSDEAKSAVLGQSYGVRLPLRCPGLAEAIALAFQVCHDGRAAKV